MSKKFIELTSENGMNVLVNIDTIQTVLLSGYDDAPSKIVFNDGKEGWARESYDEVKALIREAELAERRGK